MCKNSEIIFVVIFKTIASVAQPENMTYDVESYGYLVANNCGYNKIQENDLPHADARNFSFPENSIFFTETSCEGGLNFRQACSVESAARAHPNRQVNVLFTVPVTRGRLRKRPLNGLLAYPNIKFFRIHLHKYGKKTPLKTIMAHDLLLSTKFIHHAADVLRFLTLYKFGGIFMDLDTIVVKSFDTLPLSRGNFVGKEDDDTFSVGVVAFSNDNFGRIMANATVTILKHEFNPYEWISNGIEIFRKAMNDVFKMYKLRVKSKNGNILIKSPDRRLNFTVYDTNFFYPIAYTNVKRMFQPGTLDLTNVYAVHFWNSITKFMFVSEGSLFTNLANQFCPRMMKLYRFVNTRRSQAKKLYEGKLSGTVLKLRTARKTFQKPRFSGPLAECDDVSKEIGSNESAHNII